jgi:hypothetical protein
MFLDRVRGEFDEMPDLKLTHWQACRLWNVDSQLCDDILYTLVREGFLWQTATGAYLRRTTGRRLSFRASGPDWFPAGRDDDHAEVELPVDDEPGAETTTEEPGRDVEAELIALGI